MYRRNLPHWHPPGASIFVTWRLAGSWYSLQPAIQKGPTRLCQPEIAECVVNGLWHASVAGEYEMHAFVVMPNHMHILITPSIELAKITRMIKGKSARQANAILGRTGQPFWEDESFDHWIRNRCEFEKVTAYIEENPVRSRLVMKADQWPYSSAALQHQSRITG